MNWKKQHKKSEFIKIWLTLQFITIREILKYSSRQVTLVTHSEAETLSQKVSKPRYRKNASNPVFHIVLA
jgi:hypothetical protein